MARRARQRRLRATATDPNLQGLGAVPPVVTSALQRKFFGIPAWEYAVAALPLGLAAVLLYRRLRRP